MSNEAEGSPAQNAAERAREATLRARNNAQLAADAELQRLEDAIVKTVAEQRASVDESIAKNISRGIHYVTPVYSERISASRNTHEAVAFIEGFADTVTERLVADLQADGFKASASASEVVDPRDTRNAPPEYYDTAIRISW